MNKFAAAMAAISMASALSAQTGREPAISYPPGLRGPYTPGSVSAIDTKDSARIHDLIKAGQLNLSLQDAIALALENNLDLELQRYAVKIAQTDYSRASAGSLLRGVGLTVNEAPAGVGGPGGALNNSAASGITPQTQVPVNVTDTNLIQEAQNNLNVNGTFASASGPALPQRDPSITGTFLAPHLTTPQTSLVTTGTPSLVNNTVNANFGYSQGFWTGASVSAAWQSIRTDSNSSRNLVNPYSTSSLSVSFVQPLMRGFGREVNKRYIRIARNSERITDYVFRQQAVSTVAGVIRLYTDLVSLSEDMRVKQQTLATAERLAEDNASKVELGTIAPIELTRARAQVAAARQDLINAEGYLQQQELILKNVLTRNAGSDPVVRSARIVATDPVSVDPLPTESTDELVRLALANRPEIQAAKLQVENSDIGLRGSRNGLLPQLDLTANASNSGLAGGANGLFTGAPPAPGSLLGYGDGYFNAIEQILRRDYPSYSIGLTFTLPVHNRTAQADLVRDELQLRQAQIRTRQLENQVSLEVQDAIIALRRTRAAYEAAVETRKLQDQSLEIEQERFQAGLSTNFLVIQYENFVAQARSTEVVAKGAYAKARTQLERVIGKILENHNVSIDEALKGQVTARAQAK